MKNQAWRDYAVKNRCKGTTEEGWHCARSAVPGHEYCHYHGGPRRVKPEQVAACMIHDRVRPGGTYTIYIEPGCAACEAEAERAGGER